MVKILSPEVNSSLNKLLEALAKTLDISESQYEAIVASYRAVGAVLAASPILAPYNPEIAPQGSLVLGTLTAP